MNGYRGTCECRRPSEQPIGPCTTSDPPSQDGCSPPSCPSGERVCCNWNDESCDGKCGAGAHMVEKQCACTSCHNKYWLRVYCERAIVCGDGQVHSGEECEPPGVSCTKDNKRGTCSENCLCIINPYCGDGSINVAGEECDPPNSSCTKSGKSGVCSSSCKCVLNPYCGDGKINVSGEECDPPNSSCTKGGKAGTCSSSCKCEINPYCGDGKLDTTKEECEPPNSSCTKDGKSGVCSNVCKCVLNPPELVISKDGSVECIDDGTENPVSEILYVITISNTGKGDGAISKIEDVLDTKLMTAGIEPSGITPPGSYLDGTISWLFSTPLVIAAGQKKVFSYKVVVDKNNFGTYTNTVTLTPSTGSVLVAKADITADCTILDVPVLDVPVLDVPVVPQTGILEDTGARVLVGVGLIVVGCWIYSIPARIFMIDRYAKEEKRKTKYRIKFESKILKK